MNSWKKKKIEKLIFWQFFVEKSQVLPIFEKILSHIYKKSALENSVFQQTTAKEGASFADF